jgi:molybdenum cofactor biosynthesis enzyme MoaA
MKGGFANILFSGPCNLHCPCCIGKMLLPLGLPDNLDLFPLRGLDTFLSLVNEEGISQISITGVDTDPQLYRHEERLLSYIRSRTGRDTRISLHTNGRLILEKSRVFNLYDRATISFPSFTRDIYRKMTGSSEVPDLQGIIRQSRIPLKVSTLISEHNVREMREHLQALKSLGILRVVLRKPYGEESERNPFQSLAPGSYFMNNPVYDFRGLEVTYWQFETTDASCLNLFSSGEISRSYLLERKAQDG